VEGVDLFVGERAHGRRKITIAAVSGLGEQPLASFLSDVAAGTPAPGGGSSAAVALALGASLVEMSATLAGDSESAARAARLRAEALELAEAELSSYAPVLEAARLPRDDPSRAARLERALLEATRTPVAIAEQGAEVAELGAKVAVASSPSVRGDAVTGVVIAEAACAAAAGLVEVNLARQSSAPALARARDARARATNARSRVEPSRDAGRGGPAPT
jgi:methenyltetrahydrofolate cyclohydrolase